MSEGWKTRLEEAVRNDARAPRAISIDAGLGPNYLSELFTQDKTPTVDKLLKLCATLGVSAAYILSGVKASRQSEEMLAILSGLSEDEQATLLRLARHLQEAAQR